MQTEEALVSQGVDAEEMLNNSKFNAVIDSLVQDCFGRITATKPSELDQREQAYFLYRGLVEIVNTLQQRVAVMNEIKAKNESANSNNSGE